MRINLKIVTTVLALGWLYESVANFRNQRKAKKQLKEAESAFDTLHELNVYLAYRLAENEVAFTEFDEIAINSMLNK